MACEQDSQLLLSTKQRTARVKILEDMFWSGILPDFDPVLRQDKIAL